MKRTQVIVPPTARSVDAKPFPAVARRALARALSCPCARFPPDIRRTEDRSPRASAVAMSQGAWFLAGTPELLGHCFRAAGREPRASPVEPSLTPARQKKSPPQGAPRIRVRPADDPWPDSIPIDWAVDPLRWVRKSSHRAIRPLSSARFASKPRLTVPGGFGQPPALAEAARPFSFEPGERARRRRRPRTPLSTTWRLSILILRPVVTMAGLGHRNTPFR